eukprot:403365085
MEDTQSKSDQNTLNNSSQQQQQEEVKNETSAQKLTKPLKLSTEEFRSRSQACILSAFIGDAAGGVLEFQHNFSPRQIEKAIKLPGGGVFGLGEGQITDDSEMAMCLFQALSNGYGKMNLDDMAGMYKQWVDSNPFDIGITTRKALYGGDGRASTIFQKVQQFNASSQSNGSLMRITPLAVWASKLSNEDLYKAVHLQTYFTHCNKAVIEATYLYCLVIKLILNGETDRVKIYNDIKKEAGQLDMEEVLQWFNQLELEGPPVATINAGWAKIAFLYTFHYLRNPDVYPKDDLNKILKDILSQEGDTDTNAAIVLGVMGAFNKREELNQDQVTKLLAYQCVKNDDRKTNNGIQRPDFLIPGKVLTEEAFNDFFKMMPTKLEVVYEKRLLNQTGVDELCYEYLVPKF